MHLDTFTTSACQKQVTAGPALITSGQQFHFTSIQVYMFCAFNTRHVTTYLYKTLDASLGDVARSDSVKTKQKNLLRQHKEETRLKRD